MLRKLRISLMLIAILTVAPFGAADAQDLPPDDLGDFEDGTNVSEESGSFSNLSRYFGVTLGASSTTSDAVDITRQTLTIEVNLPASDSFKTKLSFDVGNFEGTHKQELQQAYLPAWQKCQGIDRTSRDWEVNACDAVFDEATGAFLPLEIEIPVDESYAEANEAYIQYEPTDWMILRVGRQPLVIGQFDVFSPLMFLSPIKATGTKIRGTRADLAVSQDAVNVSLFPVSNIEVSAYAAPGMRIDPVTESERRTWATQEDYRYSPGEGQSNAFQDIDDHALNVARLVYYGDSVTFGVTVLEGADTNTELVRVAKIIQKDSEYFLADDEGVFFPELKATAVEFAYRMAPKWSFILEHVAMETQSNWDLLPREEDGYTEQHYQEIINNGFQQVIDKLNGKTTYDVNLTISSAGLVYKGDRWLANLQLAQFSLQGATVLEEDLSQKLDLAVRSGEEPEDFNDVVIPVLGGVRLLGQEKQGYVGFGFGVYNGNLGFGIAGGWRFFERLELGAFAGSALDDSAGGSGDLPERQEYTTPSSDGSFSLALNYLF